MRKLKCFEHISLDGVIQASSGEEENDDFPYGNWTTPYRTPEGLAKLIVKQGESFALLLGRRTYDLWSKVWPAAPKSPMADRLNAATKYVATHRRESLQWGPFESVGPDLIAGVRNLKTKEGPDLILWGSSTLTSSLLAHGIVDEVVLIVYPALLGKGKRFFAEGTPARSFALIESEALPSGVVVNTYQFSGPLKSSKT